jgi:hypothetical protein
MQKSSPTRAVRNNGSIVQINTFLPPLTRANQEVRGCLLYWFPFDAKQDFSSFIKLFAIGDTLR